MKEFINKEMDGKASVGVALLLAGGIFSLQWLLGFVFNSPAKQAQAVDVVDKKVLEISNTVNLLCNDYGQTISRIDQNLQNFGRTLGASVVVGKASSDPCKINK